ncbi:hypothetical protein DMA12_38560 [Amycolatopsis balhimycina DSM 5908]|uniref:Uncharacterized protein n=1 Tax=Amycolatopsis balhimycina DSM 5908 TaxID=1081091 RepID=A0A428W1F8_AMYBA|nr:hypothetical protein [Amycolatopsis balhimycina]RSM36867.1 hypothetical protein DMA12_38560 [Amycolatopsis balhimycina DSM 5908]
MASTDLENVPVENTVRALRRLAPGAALREPRTPELRALARALRDHAPSELARTHPVPVARVVLAGQLRALDRAVIGFFGACHPAGPEAARLARAAHYSRTRHSRTRRAGPLLDRLRAEPGLRAAALGWAEACGHRILAGELRGVPEVPAAGDGRLAAELAVAALLPAPDRGGRVPSGDLVRTGSAFLDVRSLRIGDRGFRVDVESAAPVELVRDEEGLTLRALWWKGLGRVTDDLGHEYLVLAKDPAGTPRARHWCHPRPAPGARVLRLESAGYRGERLRLDVASAGSSADVLVKLELTVRLGA